METDAVNAITFIELENLKESATNPRKHYDEKSLQDLATSIKEKGVINPLIVRKNGKGYEIVAGSRRYRAAVAAGQGAVPVIIRTYTDAEVLEIQVIENNQREDVHPLEEADGYAALLKIDGYNADVIAAKIGRSVKYVKERLQLSRLIPEAKKKLEKDEILYTHARLISRLQHEQQLDALEFVDKQSWDGQLCTAKELENWIESEYENNLSGACFKLDDAELLPIAGACNSCPKNTACDLQLFADKGKKKICTDPVCFKAKQDKAIENKFDAMQAAGEKVILISSNYTPRNPTIEIGGDKQSVIGSSKYDEVKKSDKNAVKALVIDGYNGDGRGQIKYVKLAKEMEVSKSGKVGMSKSESARIKKKKEKRKAEKDAKLARIEKIFSKTPRDPIKYVRAISEVMLDDYGTFGYAKEQIVKLMGWTEEIKEAKESKELHRFAKRKLKDADLGEMLKFICCCYLADDIRSEWAGDKRIRVFELTALGPVGKKKKVVKMKAVKKGKRGRPRKSK